MYVCMPPEVCASSKYQHFISFLQRIYNRVSFRNILFCPAIFVCNTIIKVCVIPRPGIKVKLLLEGRPVAAASSIFSLCSNGSLCSNRKNVTFVTKWNIQCTL